MTVAIGLKSILSTYLFLLLLFYSCANEKTPLANKENLIQGDSTFLILDQGAVLLKEAPHETAKNIAILQKGTKVFPTGEVSSNKTLIYIDDIPYNEPWIYVHTSTAKTGWIYGAILKEKQVDNFPDLIMNAFLGEEITERLLAYQSAYHSEETKDHILSLLREARVLQELLSEQLQQSDHLAMSQHSNLLQSYLPALKLYENSTSSEYSLFLDFREWSAKAKLSDSSCDDQLMALYYKVYPIDSIEYFHPSWTLEVDAERAYSLLGEGIHLSILQELDKLLNCHDVLQLEIDRIKEGILNDILQPNVLYWEDQEKVLKEIAQITVAKPLCLQDSEYQYLVQRLESLRADSLTNKSLFNFRSGIR